MQRTVICGEGPLLGHSSVGLAFCASQHDMHTKPRAHQQCLPADMDEHVADSPYQVTVLPGPPAAQRSVIDGLGRRAAHVGTKASFEIEARDAHGNRCLSRPPAN